MSSQNTTVAFIGLGNMGAPMAKNLLSSGLQVRAYDLMPELLQSLAREGAYAAHSAHDACEGASIVVSMLPAGKHVASLFMGDEGLCGRLAKGSLIIDSSTIDAETARALHESCENHGLFCLDSPVSGGVVAAQAGTLAFMCGGSSEAFDKAQPILNAMGKNIFHAGPAGAGQVAKMCNNMLLAIHMIGTSEALTLGEKNGVNASTLSEIMRASSGDNWSLEKYNPFPGVMPAAPASNNYEPGFMVDLMAKDLGLAIDNAKSNDAGTPLGKLAQSLFIEKQAAGDGKRDFSSIIELIASKPH